MVSLHSDCYNYYLSIFFQTIDAPFPEGATNREESMESPNSRMVIEASLDEIPWTSSFNSQMFQVKDVETPNSRVVVVVNLDEILLTSNVDSDVPCLLMTEANPFHMIFDVNGVLIATHFDRGSCTIILCPGLKEFLEKCLAQFQVYIWSVAQKHNIYNYLDHTWHKT